MLDLVTTIPFPGSQIPSSSLSSENLISNQSSKLPLSKHCGVSLGFDKYILASNSTDFELKKFESTRNLYISDYLDFSPQSYNVTSYNNSADYNSSSNDSFDDDSSIGSNFSLYANCYNGNSSSVLYDESSDSYYNDDGDKPAWSKEEDWERIRSWESFYACSPSEQPENIVKLCYCMTVESSQEKNSKKKVSFADDCGLNLSEIRILTESPDTPPVLPEKIIFDLLEKVSITESLADYPAISSSPKSVPSNLKSPAKAPWKSKYNFVPNFTLPAIDSAEFTAKLESSYVTLESIDVKPSSIAGRVQVRNKSVDKLVKIHLTFDEWKSTSDYTATPVPDPTLAYPNCDIFSFEIELPNILPAAAKIQFSVCCACEGIEHWDNNDGQNFELIQKKMDREARRKAALEADLRALEGLDNVYALAGVSRNSSRANSLPYW